MMKNIIAVISLLVSMHFFSSPALANEPNAQFLQTVQDYLTISEKYVALANTQEAALYFAIEGIVEIHEERGELAKAVPHLTRILDQYPANQTVRNLVHLKLRDVYKQTGRTDLALHELENLIDENR